MSGSGKTSLLRSICDLRRSEYDIEGRIAINGITNFSFLKKSQGRIGFMFQSSTLLPNLTAKENILLPARIIDGRNVNMKLYQEIVQMVGLVEHETKYPSELSVGMRSRVALAGVYMTTPEILLLDEPFSSLDVAWKYELYQKFFDLKERFKTTIMIVTHDIQEAILLAHRILVLRKDGSLGNTYSIERDNKLASPLSVKSFLQRHNDKYLDIQNEILSDLKDVRR
jgi:sulfonate transport system ATP-binding protein